ncbi:four helix bundle protein [Candidatus Gottesmanbacteria bacterium]|nr:four helix bundle protein [Candidatus Gottesmanbacteria bacterium]
MQKFRKLQVWQKSMDFITHIYIVTKKYPPDELFSITNQIRRAAVSIALNIAEGSGSGSDKEFSRFLRIAIRSGYEVIAGLEIGIRLNYGEKDENEQLILEVNEIGAMITGLIKKLKSDS